MADLFAYAERLMSMDGTVWARHANPRSVWTRIAGGTVLFFALWSPFWISWWGAVLIALALLWVWLNPRAFPPPTHTESWATKGVLGERVFLNRKAQQIPAHHQRAAMVATVLSGAFLALTVLAFFQRDFLAAFTAWHAATVAKIWFVDRMSWLWDDMKDATPLYRAWNRAEWDAQSPLDHGDDPR